MLFAIISLFPYIISILNGRTKPHLFSWIIWTLLTWVTWAIQYADGAEAGAWPTLVTGLFCMVILALAVKRGHKDITRSDWISFVLGLSSVPLWIYTKDPTYSALLVTAIDLSAFYPTIRKSWSLPREELAFKVAVSSVKHAFSFAALSNVSIATATFPIAVGTMNMILVSIILGRRWVLHGNFKNK